jgi:hypothetical protein
VELISMNKAWKQARWISSGLVLFGLGGCVTSQQMMDFGRTEFARVIADTIGQIFSILVQATT